MHVYFNPLDKACKSVLGAVEQGEKLVLNLFCLRNETRFFNEKTGEFRAKTPSESEYTAPKERAFLRLNQDGERAEFFPMTETQFGWSVSFALRQTGLYYYSFYIENKGNVACGYMETGHFSTSDRVDGFLLTVYEKGYTTPDWFKGGVMYQIFPDRFCKVGSMPDINGRIERKWGEMPYFRPNEQGKVLNNDFFGGNFKGIESKLPYLSDLGVTTIYLNPIFEAGSNHRYDTSDYRKIDPILGDEKDFAGFLKSAEKYGIRVILDGVFSHTGDNSIYFNKYGAYPSVGAYQSKDSPYYSWYSFQEFPDKYSSWWGIDILPEVNEHSEEYQRFICGKDGVLEKWLQFGIGGYRLDVADELPDEFLKILRKSVKNANKDAIIIGEVWEDASNKIAYSKRREYLQGLELDSVMNYPLKDGILRYIQTGNASELLHCVRVLINHYPKQTLDALMNVLGTHDTARILTVLGGIYCQNKEEMAKESALLTKKGREIAIEKLKMCAVLQFTLPGVPCIYYGDENGMEGHIDPFCRQCFNWDNLNVELIEFYTKLGNLRKTYREIFKDGEFKDVITSEGLFVYKRSKNKTNIYVYTNNSSKPYLLNIGKEKLRNALTQETFEKQIELKANSYGILIAENA